MTDYMHVTKEMWDAAQRTIEKLRQRIGEYVSAREAVLDYSHKYLESGGSPLTMPKRWHQLDTTRQAAFDAMRAALSTAQQEKRDE